MPPGKRAEFMTVNEFSIRKRLILCSIVIGYLIVALLPRHDTSITQYYFEAQDMAVGFGAAILFLALAIKQPAKSFTTALPRDRTIWLAAGVLTLLLWAGTYLIMCNHALTRDEHMVLFDARIFGGLQLSQPLVPEWRRFAEGLVPAFLLDVPSHQILVSAYGPGNAMMRAAFGSLFDPSLMNPVLAGIGLIALFRIAKDLFPTSPSAVWVCLLGYVLSSQILTNAMTAYAMTAHLTLNLVWLAFFLRGDRWGYLATMIIGSWAIGLHQIVFHPLFAGPLILTLIPQKRWALFAAYAVVYGASLLFWISYPTFVMDAAGIAAAQGSGAGSAGFIQERIVPLIVNHDPATLVLTFYNLLRYIAWAPLFMLPLLVLSSSAIRRREGLALPLFCGAVLTLLAMVFLLPYQGHGWGYRYLHPVSGNLILLAGYGYDRWLAKDDGGAQASVALMGGLTAIVAVPFLVFTTFQLVKPQADLLALINRQQTDFVLVDTEYPSNAIDQVRNMADLSNRPIVFSSEDLNEDQLIELCGRGSLALITRKDFHRAGFVPQLAEQSPIFDQRVKILVGNDCLSPTLD